MHPSSRSQVDHDPISTLAPGANRGVIRHSRLTSTVTSKQHSRLAPTVTSMQHTRLAPTVANSPSTTGAKREFSKREFYRRNRRLNLTTKARLRRDVTS